MTTNYHIVLLPGDGIGPEVVREAELTLAELAPAFGFSLTFETHLLGGCAIDATGQPLPADTLAACRSADCRAVGRGGRPQMERSRGQCAPGTGPAGAAQGIGTVRQSAPGQDLPATARRLHPASQRRWPAWTCWSSAN